ncbi:MAG: hypothetical protein ACPG3W_04510 [Synechococcus sp.]|uniref:hypothetical protein n=1 Tax=Synechococcus sp. BMK-MC-1 TaxID=1442551 RepID=UPI001648571F|nr:hypothetical protein [Synechococcus sp. BMK-MC-1]QNI66992.1 hypothetical protein SynBMKMC1_00908 [Synechococcus sp. BMK-MC-1]
MADDLLKLSDSWGHSQGDGTDIAPLVPFEQALESSCLRRNISRDDFLKSTLTQLNHQRLIPLLFMLPRRWRLQPAALPQSLRNLGSVLEHGLLSPLLLAALADDLQHLIAHEGKRQPTKKNAMDRWCQRSIDLDDGSSRLLPTNLIALQSISSPDSAPPSPGAGALARVAKGFSAELQWSNEGLPFLQPENARLRNRALAQVLNVLGSNRLPPPPGSSEPFRFESCDRSSALITHLIAGGWQCRARFRASVASFGLGASTRDGDQWSQIPLAVPYRTGLCDSQGEERRALLPHCSLEMELQPDHGEPFLLQYYQGTEGLNGWAALNDLNRPWQNDRSNGTVAYPGPELTGETLSAALDLCDLMGAVHNSAAQQNRLVIGGYGALGYCIDSTAMLEVAVRQTTHLFPLTLGGLWRQRLDDQLNQLLENGLKASAEMVERYRQSLDTTPQDLFVNRNSVNDANRRLLASQPPHSPFALVRSLNGESTAKP